MKKIFICLLLSFPVLYSFAQIKDGSKVFTSTISNFGIYSTKSKTTSDNNPTSSTGGSGFGLTPELIYGKIKNNNLLSFGLSLTYQLIKQIDASNKNAIAIAPVITYEKFYPITNKLYFTPFTRLSLGYQYASQAASSFSSRRIEKGLIGSFSFRPFSLTFAKNPRTNFLFTIGNLYLDFSRIQSYIEGNLNNSKTISTNLTINGSLGGIGFGIQKLL